MSEFRALEVRSQTELLRSYNAKISEALAAKGLQTQDLVDLHSGLLLSEKAADEGRVALKDLSSSHPSYGSLRADLASELVALGAAWGAWNGQWQAALRDGAANQAEACQAYLKLRDSQDCKSSSESAPFVIQVDQVRGGSGTGTRGHCCPAIFDKESPVWLNVMKIVFLVFVLLVCAGLVWFHGIYLGFWY